jgi:N-acetylglucosaminyldiphosphoundecaprenol N-acetyl-beta-D-mannosaminyltransferase
MLAAPGGHTVIPVNPEMVIAARSNPEFRRAINEAGLALPDGTGVLLATRLQGLGPAERVAGADAVQEIARIAARDSLGLFLLGAGPGVAEEAGRALAARHEGLKIAGTHAGTPDPREDDEICARVNSSGAAVLLVAYGAPGQELWIMRNHARLSVRLAMAVGGTFDFLSGRRSRAPRWMRDSGLEWLYRLAQEPRRWRRMLALPRFALLALTERITR